MIFDIQKITWATLCSNSVGSTSLSLEIFFIEVYIFKYLFVNSKSSEKTVIHKKTNYQRKEVHKLWDNTVNQTLNVNQKKKNEHLHRLRIPGSSRYLEIYA